MTKIKSLEALERLKMFPIYQETKRMPQQFRDKESVNNDLSIIEKELKRLAKIDCLFEEIGIDENDLCVWFELQKQDGKELKALEITKEKLVNLFHLAYTDTKEAYNDLVSEHYRELTQEEYDLLKEVLL